MDASRRILGDGIVWVADGSISDVTTADQEPPAHTGSPVIPTAGTIYPGMIELHIAGTTTSQGLTPRSAPIKHLYKGIVRSAELPDAPGLDPARPKIGDVTPGSLTSSRKSLARRGARILHHGAGSGRQSPGLPPRSGDRQPRPAAAGCRRIPGRRC